jgi:hypothetical protein
LTKFSVDELNTYFTTPAASTGSSDICIISYRPLILFFVLMRCVFAASIRSIISNATGLDGIPLVFIKLLLPLILPVLTKLFYFIDTSSTFSLVSTSSQLPKVNFFTEKSDYRPFSILSVLTKDFENV